MTTTLTKRLEADDERNNLCRHADPDFISELDVAETAEDERLDRIRRLLAWVWSAPVIGQTGE